MFYIVDFCLGFLVAKWIGESEESCFSWRSTEHMLESKNELVVIVDKIVCFGKDATPLFLSIWKDTENWLETLAI